MMNKQSSDVRWSLFSFGEWKFYIAATEKGLCYVGSQHRPFEEMEAWIGKRMPDSIMIEDDAALQPYAVELAEYMGGVRHQFTQPFDCRGTAFQRLVWEALSKIPYGQTVTYSDIASQIGRPAAVRAVGTAIGANPNLIAIPCHRVVGKDGSLTGYRGGFAMKSELLKLEQSGLTLQR